MTAQDRPRAEAPVPARLAIPLPALAPLTAADLWYALRAGAADFRKAPDYGLAVATGVIAVALALRLAGAGALVWGLTGAIALPLLAPFILGGFYLISAQRRLGQSVDMAGVLAHVSALRLSQAPWVGLCLALAAGLWLGLAALLWWGLGGSELGVMLQALWALAAGAVLYGIAAISLPMLHDCRLDALTAMLHSQAMLRDNRGVMLLWALIVAGLLALAAASWFVGLVVVLPVLGHAHYHLYRRATRDA